MKKFIISGLIISGLYADTISVYTGDLTYKNSDKKYTFISGIYSKLLFTDYSKWEFDLSGLKVKYKTKDNYYEVDNTILYHYYSGLNWDYRIGIHNILSRQDGDNYYNKIFIGGISYYRVLDFNIGSNLYYGIFKNNLKSYQISPKVGLFFSNFYLESKLNIIHLNQNVNNRQNYLNIDLKLDIYLNKLTTSIVGNYGKNSYKVDNNGFIVYNLGDEYKYNYGAIIDYKINNNLNITFSYKRSCFIENNQNAYSNSYIGMIGWKF